jgi:hypothetical protein
MRTSKNYMRPKDNRMPSQAKTCPQLKLMQEDEFSKNGNSRPTQYSCITEPWVNIL